MRECGPFAAVNVSHEIEYGATVSSAPRFVPSTLNWTPATDPLSVAFALTGTIAETVAPFVGDVIETVGGVVSAAATRWLRSTAGPTLPAASSAVTL